MNSFECYRKSGLILLLVLTLGISVAAADSIGTGYAENGSGGAESVGRALVAGEPFHGGARGAVVRLDNGNVLRLAAGASALFEPAVEGDVRVQVLAGRVVVVIDDRRPLLAGAGSRFKLSPVFHDAAAAEERLLSLEMTGAGREGLEPRATADGPAGRGGRAR